MLQTERHYHKGNKQIVELCKYSKELYNAASYMMRHAYFNKQKLPNILTLKKETKDLNCFKQLKNTKIAMQIIIKLLIDWSNFKQSLIAYNKDKSKYKCCPKPPKYKKKLNQIIFYNETIKRSKKAEKK